MLYVTVTNCIIVSCLTVGNFYILCIIQQSIISKEEIQI